MKKSHEIIGLVVVSIQNGVEIGSVKQLIIDASNGSIAGLLVDDGKWNLGAKAVPFSAIVGIGQYAVTISSEDDIISAAVFDNLLALDVHVVGSLALSRSGNIMGNVNEIIIADDGAIVECIIENAGGGFNLPAERVITYGKDVLIVADEGDIKPLRQFNKPIVTTAPVTNTNNNVKISSASNLSAPVDITSFATEPLEVDTATNLAIDSSPPPEENDALAKLFEEMQRKYLLGKKAGRCIKNDSGEIIVDQGQEITETILQQAKAAGKFVELSMSINLKKQRVKTLKTLLNRDYKQGRY